jgi:flagellar motor protein MotB
MKHLVKLSGIAVLCLFIGIVAPAYAQEEHHDDQAKPEQRTEPKQKQQSKSAQRAQQKQEAKQSKSSQHAAQKQEAQQAKSAQHSQKQDRAQQAGPAQQTERASNNGGGSIPDARFRAHFGRNHAFRINRPVLVGGTPRFQYGGYWFGFGEPWPVGWSYSDQVYVDYINGGYFLLSPVHPGVQISISVVL